MKFIKSLDGRAYQLKTYPHHVQIKVVHGDKIYLGRANGETLRRVHRTATQAQTYAKAVFERLGRLRLRAVQAAIAAKLAQMPIVSADTLVPAPRVEGAVPV